MTNKIVIKTRCGNFNAELDDSDISNVIWLSDNISIEVNMFGGMIYGELPPNKVLVESHTINLDIGDIAYWSGPNALCIFFGKMPLSGGNMRSMEPFSLTKIGKIIGDCSMLENIGDRQLIFIVRAF